MTDNNVAGSAKSTAGSENKKMISDARILRGTVTMQQTKMKNYIDTPDRFMPLSEVETRLSLLESYMVRFNEFQTRLEVEDPEEQQGDKRYLYEETYIYIKSKLLSLIEQKRPRASLPSSSSFSMHTKNNVRLPKLQIKPFSGNFQDWTDFYATFRTLVEDNDDITNVEKLAYLRGSLQAGPLEVINNICLDDDGFNNAIDLLKSRYENKRLIFQGHIRNLFDIKPIEKTSVVRLRALSDLVNSHLRALKGMATIEQIMDGLLLNLIGNKIDSETKLKWEEEAPLNVLPSLGEFSSFLDKRCQALENADFGNNEPTRPRKVETFKPNSHNRKHYVQRPTVSVNHVDVACALCKKRDHDIAGCEDFRNLSPLERYTEIKRLNACINCLKLGHRTTNCKSRGCKYCNFKHHTLLHRNQVRDGVMDSNSKAEASPKELGAPDVTCLVGSNADEKEACADVVLATAIVDVENDFGLSIPYRSLLDGGSTSHFVTEKLVQQLRLKKSRVHLNIDAITLAPVKVKHKVRLVIRSRVNEFSTSIEALVVPKITNDQPCRKLNTKLWKIPGNIVLADPTFNTPQPIDILIGAGLFYKLLSVGQIFLGDHLPILQKTLLGWIVGGGEESRAPRCLVAIQNQDDDGQDLEKMVERFWEVEQCGSQKRALTMEESDCEKHFLENLRRNASGRFQVRLPFRRNPSVLGNSIDTARKRFFSLEHKLSRNPEIRKQYSEFMEEYSALGHMELISSPSSLDKYYVLPHHCVLKPESSSTKLRVVFDASCKTSSGISLNDTLMVGPVIQDDLFSILLRFRSYKYAITADISKMYRQVQIQHPDTNWQCVLWRNNPKEDLKLYRLLTVTYGTAPASFLATGCLRQLALDCTAEFPLGSKVLQRDFYVDDMLTGASSIDEARALCREINKLLNSGGFELSKWCSNCPDLLSIFNASNLEKYLHISGDNFVKTLGMFWQPQSDEFRFFSQRLERMESTKRVTKRTVLSIISRLFDPLGLLNPIIVKAKIFLQQLWNLKLTWDESLPQKLHSSWISFYEQLSLVDQINIPRFVWASPSHIEIHGFADASSAAYGACIYARCIINGTISCNLLTAKSRVAPLKTLSIPRLELCAALLLAELTSRVVDILKADSGRIYCWSDSTIVLSWLASSPARWSVFVSNRVSKIQNLTQDFKWRHISSHLNPADLLSRGLFPNELRDSELWLHGPGFLCSPKKSWPKMAFQTEQQLPEGRKTVVALVGAPTENLVESSKFGNSFVRLVNTFAYIYRFYSNSRIKTTNLADRTHGPISAEEFEQELVSIVRLIQKYYLADDYHALNSGKALKSNSSLKSLNPFMDSNGLIRVGGRLNNAELDFDAKHQFVLPKSNFTRSLVRYYHHKHLHVGCQTLLAVIRNRFWILGGRVIIKQIIRNCVRCSRLRPKIMEQLMGQLPSPRVQPSPVFYHTGVDFCGPFYIKHIIRNRAPIKTYVCLFVCLCVKAVHIEVATNLSTEAFLSAFIKFKARRPNIRVVYSDNATNFVGGYRELQELNELFKSEEHSRLVQEMCSRDGISWKFIPPRSPHFGGLWEAAIKQAKHHLRRVLGLQPYSMDELQRITCQVESILNSRPLIPLTDDVDDLQALTPGHFLVGGPMVGVPHPTLVDVNVNRLSRWQQLQANLQTFWLRWQREYLQGLQRRSKWKSIHPDIKVGSLVILKEDNLPPFKWALGRIKDIHTGDDGHVRVVVVRTMGGIVKRAITKICPLPVEQENDSNVLEADTSKAAGLC